MFVFALKLMKKVLNFVKPIIKFGSKFMIGGDLHYQSIIK